MKDVFYRYLQGQVGNPEGEDKPNKKFYDPRVWIRKAEESMIKRADESFEFLNSKGMLGSDWSAWSTPQTLPPLKFISSP